MVRDLDLSVSHIEVDESQTLSVSKRRGASFTLEHEQHKKANTSMETAPVLSISALKRTPVKAVPEGLRNVAAHPPEGTPLQEKPTWPSAPPLEVKKHAAERAHLLQKKASDREVDANHSL